MNKTALMLGMTLAAAVAARADETAAARAALAADPAGGAGLACLYEADCAGVRRDAAVAAAGAPAATERAALFPAADARKGRTEIAVPPPAPSGDRGERSGSGVWSGVAQGATQGAEFGLYAGLSPAVALLSRGLDGEMGHHYDGRPAGHSEAYMRAGIVVAAVLYAPALALGAVGGLFGSAAGGISEAVSPGSTKSWNAERYLFDSRR